MDGWSVHRKLNNLYLLLVSFFWLVGVVAQLTLTSCRGTNKRPGGVGFTTRDLWWDHTSWHFDQWVDMAWLHKLCDHCLKLAVKVFHHWILVMTAIKYIKPGLCCMRYLIYFTFLMGPLSKKVPTKHRFSESRSMIQLISSKTMYKHHPRKEKIYFPKTEPRKYHSGWLLSTSVTQFWGHGVKLELWSI